MNFEQALTYGKDGEHAVARLLISRGVVVQPLYQHTDKHAPVLLYQSDRSLMSAILPDLTCWHAKRQYFAEVKRKTRWVIWNGRRETGFNLRLFHHYMDVRRQTGAPLYVFFLHERQEPTGVFYAELGRLAPTLRIWDGLRIGTSERIEKALALFDANALTKAWDLSEAA